MRAFRSGLAVAAAAVVFSLTAAPAGASLAPKELKCSEALAKNFAKLQTTILKTRAKCHDNDISGKEDSADACATLPTKAQEKVDKARAKFIAKIAKSCSSVCSISTDVACVSDLGCPARHIGVSSSERCLGKGGSAPLDLADLDWPGPYCTSILGHAMRAPEDLGTCTSALVDATADAIDANVYGGLDETSGLTGTTPKCASSIDKAVQKAVTAVYIATASCRDERRSARNVANPFANAAYECTVNDPATMASIDDALAKMSASIEKSCGDGDISAMGNLCSGGGPSPTDIAGAESCLSDMVMEVATSEKAPHRHTYVPRSMINATHPDSAKGYCGDGVVTATREEHTGVGEECDGSDAPCGSGHCLPPGDVFECTCSSTPRERFIVDGDISKTDSDAGWMGTSHDATHNDGFGYVSALTNCDCSAFTGASCTGSSGDPICDVRSNMAPRCSDDIDGTQTCDERGNGNGLPEDWDCNRCDDDSLNPGTFCAAGSAANEAACQSQCFDLATDTATGTPCSKSEDCGAGKVCKGRCDNSIKCNTMTDGSPLPLVSAANPVCVQLEYKTDVVGTKNMVTGEQDVTYAARSMIALGPLFAQPCPICGGVCSGGSDAGHSCFGRCNVSNDECLLDADCTAPGDTACLETADDCAGGTCSLDLRCSSGQSIGQLCEPDARTPLGIVSHDCRPVPSAAISGVGVQQNYGTFTTGTVEFPAGGPCTDSSWGNYDCPCPADSGMISGVPTRPNSCQGACDGGVNLGKGCGTAQGDAGAYTTCAAPGADAGLPCDADSDCDSGLCNGNPKECTAGSARLIGTLCSTGAECGPGGVCSDACPGARCVPLCYPEGRCVGGGRDGDPCATVDQCMECTAGNPLLIGKACTTDAFCDTTSGSGDGTCAVGGGVACTVVDPEDGMCVGGPTKFRCTGAGYTTIPCTLSYGHCQTSLTCTSGPPDKIGDACLVDGNCGVGGVCARSCTEGSPSKHNLACTMDSDCIDTPNVPVSSGCETGIDSIPGTDDDIPGAGECEPRPEDCFVNNGFAEGGDTTNGRGDATNVKIVADFCTPPNASGAINSASGFGGPSRVRRSGTAIVNVPSIAP